MCIGIFSLRAFDRRLARLAAPISSGVRQGGGGGGRICPPPSGARSAEYPSGARVKRRSQTAPPKAVFYAVVQNVSKAGNDYVLRCP